MYVKSKNNIADYFSRSSTNPEETETIIPGLNANDVYVNHIERGQLPVKFEQVKAEISKDKILCKVLDYIRVGWPEKLKDNSLTPYFNRRRELSEESGAIFWGFRILIPESIRKTLLNEIHSTHLGIVKMKSLARSYFWWPGLDKDLEEIANSCENCLTYGNNPQKSNLIPWKWPSSPWERLHLDFMGPVFKKHFLILVDAHSKWLECIDMNNNITSKRTIEELRPIFSRFGIPKVIVTDNGTSFVSKEFELFLKSNGI